MALSPFAFITVIGIAYIVDFGIFKAFAMIKFIIGTLFTCIMLEKIYSLLLGKYGKQGWWPLSKDGLESRHHNGAPCNDKDKFEIIVGAILTQYIDFSY
jgi:hypothetical protein